MKTLVIGGTGTVGSQVVKELLARGTEVKVLTRNADKAMGMSEKVEVIAGDILNPSTVRSVFKGVDAVFMLNPVSTTETSEGLFAVNGARLAGVKRFVYMSVHEYERAIYLPHFGSKLAVEAAIKSSGMAYTFLRPNNFYQNDFWYKDVILQHKVYPQPIGSVGISRVDVRDIAEAAAIAITTDSHEGEVYNMVGPEPMTGQRTAEVWSEVLGIPISYVGDDMDAWEQQSLQYLPSWMVFDFRLMYEYFQKEGLHATAQDIDRQTKLLGHAPRSFHDFARETAKSWSVMA
ncbi:NmrA family NAD(P)-binding protein [Pontibacter korlensis]|uniref:NmrA-like domain-containing protein n=1 Tax=Pontibacter korlensis TaxID=400092 RepID=A0A0E3UX90_9BACT|nr:NmrA family NAD(P)-binding protein [Pontibacter korlensis]AKD04027.1 hypothetical protein PKOR_14150 [Pontibacter korlensis]